MTKRVLWNDGWEFVKREYGIDVEEVNAASFRPVSLPHDYLIYNTDNLYEDSTGCYRKVFYLEPRANTSYEIYFEGVYMDTLVYLNHQLVGEWKYGYSSFYFDITPFLVAGENELRLSVFHKAPNSRWYSGAGIYRNVYLTEKEGPCFITDSLYVSCKADLLQGKTIRDIPNREALEKDSWEITASAELSMGGEETELDTITAKLLLRKKNGEGKDFALGETGSSLEDYYAKVFEFDGNTKEDWQELTSVSLKQALTNNQEGNFLIELKGKVNAPKLWDISSPHLYEAMLVLEKEEQQLAAYHCTTAFRSFSFDSNRGFFLNGEHTKLNGVCEHHDLGALGSGYNRSAMERKLRILKDMGVNSIRTSHNMPATDLLGLTDSMGFLVMDEAFDMWEKSKTDYDYGRFFKEWHKRDVRSWIRRDRNHPSILFWSIGNEIYDCHAGERGLELTRHLRDLTRSYDERENAQIAIGSNYMPWEGAQNCADVLKFAGYNYGEKYYDSHHEKYPDWFIFGSETASIVHSRGIYHFPYSQSILADEDQQCSALGNSSTSWGAKSTEACIIAERDRAFSLGQFLWTGFDYIGEPTPYHTRNSYFGQIDTAGFPKDSYYIYKGSWTDVESQAFVHIFPYWDFNEGQIIDVRVATNAPEVELFLNGVSLGKQSIDHKSGTKLTGDYRVPFSPGELKAIAYDERGQELAREVKHSFGNVASLHIELDDYSQKNVYRAGDVVCFIVTARDQDGYPVENANNLVDVQVSGAGILAAVDNGDSTDLGQYKTSTKRLFSGKLLVCVKLTSREENLEVLVRDHQSEDIVQGKIALKLQVQEDLPGSGRLMEETLQNTHKEYYGAWVRKLELMEESDTGRILNLQKDTLHIRAKQHPDLGAELSWSVVTDGGIPSPLARIVARDEDGAGVTIQGLGDGLFRVRCTTKNQTDCVRVMSQIEVNVEGMGEANLNPYGFIAGGIYSYSEGEVSNGNEQGVATARDGRTVVGFQRVDFGDFGSDEITLPIFELGSSPTPIEIWKGIPGEEGSELLLVPTYHKQTIWNVYQPETYKLKQRIKGLQTICFVLNTKVHIKGFSFKKLEKAYERLNAGDCDSIYGDSFKRDGSQVLDIGNNVTLSFDQMDFGEAGARALSIHGRTNKENNTIHVLFEDENGNSRREIIEFVGSKEYQTMTFQMEKVTGMQKVSFLFLPGSQFDFDFFRFE